MLQQLDGDVSCTYLPESFEFLKVLLLLSSMLALIKCEIDESGEKGDVRSRHLLTSQDDAGINLSLHQPLVFVHVHFSTANTIPQVLQPLYLVLGDGVLVLVDVYQGIANASDIVGECRHGSIGYGQRLILGLILVEEVHESRSKLCLTAALWAEGIEEREGTALADDNVTEEGRYIEA